MRFPFEIITPFRSTVVWQLVHFSEHFFSFKALLCLLMCKSSECTCAFLGFWLPTPFVAFNWNPTSIIIVEICLLILLCFMIQWCHCSLRLLWAPSVFLGVSLCKRLLVSHQWHMESCALSTGCSRIPSFCVAVESLVLRKSSCTCTGWLWWSWLPFFLYLES